MGNVADNNPHQDSLPPSQDDLNAMTGLPKEINLNPDEFVGLSPDDFQKDGHGSIPPSTDLDEMAGLPKSVDLNPSQFVGLPPEDIIEPRAPDPPLSAFSVIEKDGNETVTGGGLPVEEELLGETGLTLFQWFKSLHIDGLHDVHIREFKNSGFDNVKTLKTVERKDLGAPPDGVIGITGEGSELIKDAVMKAIEDLV